MTDDPQGGDVDQGQQPGPAGQDAAQDPPSPPSGGNPEAARYRTRLREVETARDALQARVEGFLRADVDRLVTDRLAQPSDLFDVAGLQLSDLLDQDGAVDAAAVDAAVTELLASRPGLAKVPPPQWPDMGQGDRGDGPRGASWSKLFPGRGAG